MLASCATLDPPQVVDEEWLESDVRSWSDRYEPHCRAVRDTPFANIQGPSGLTSRTEDVVAIYIRDGENRTRDRVGTLFDRDECTYTNLRNVLHTWISISKTMWVDRSLGLECTQIE